jgi:trans-aconitate methyltransferase
MLLSSVELANKKLLDVGCGMGGLFEYLLSRRIDVRYTGVDILKVMIDKAKDKHLDAEFYHADIFKDNIFEDRSFDVIYASGIFNLNLGNNRAFLQNALALFLRLSNEAVVFNLLHCDSPNREDKYFYFHPDEVAEILDGFSEQIAKVEFVEAYLKNDFTVVLRLKNSK